MFQPTRLKGEATRFIGKALGLYVELVPLLVTVGQPGGLSFTWIESSRAAQLF